MSTAQSITQAAPRLRIGLRVGLLALGVFVAVAVTVVIVASSGGSRTSAAVPAVHNAPPTGARIDHRGLHDGAYLSGLAETGARLDHRGLRASSVTSGSARRSNCVFVRPEHRCIAP